MSCIDSSTFTVMESVFFSTLLLPFFCTVLGISQYQQRAFSNISIALNIRETNKKSCVFLGELSSIKEGSPWSCLRNVRQAVQVDTHMLLWVGLISCFNEDSSVIRCHNTAMSHVINKSFSEFVCVDHTKPLIYFEKA